MKRTKRVLFDGSSRCGERVGKQRITEEKGWNLPKVDAWFPQWGHHLMCWFSKTLFQLLARAGENLQQSQRLQLPAEKGNELEKRKKS